MSVSFAEDLSKIQLHKDEQSYTRFLQEMNVNSV